MQFLALYSKTMILLLVCNYFNKLSICSVQFKLNRTSINNSRQCSINGWIGMSKYCCDACSGILSCNWKWKVLPFGVSGSACLGTIKIPWFVIPRKVSHPETTGSQGITDAGRPRVYSRLDCWSWLTLMRAPEIVNNLWWLPEHASQQ